MNCHDIGNLLDSREVLELTETQRVAVNAHLRDCSRCEDEWRAVRTLRDVSTVPTPAPRQDLFSEAMRLATAAGAPREARPPRQPSFWLGAGFGGAIAASLVAAITTLGPAPWTSTVDPITPTITVALNEPRDVDVAITSAEALEQAEIRVVLTGGVRLAGFADRSEVQWRADLDQGINRLSLPVIAVNGNGGQVVVEVEHASKRQVFVVNVGVDQQAPDVA
jgi:anti-sigma factor RsiW